MAFRMRAGGFIRAGAQRVSMRGWEASGRPLRRGTQQQPVNTRIVFTGVGAAAGMVTATAVLLGSDNEGGLEGTLRPSLPLPDSLDLPLHLGRTVYADAALPVKGDDKGVTELAEGEKPELIKQADAEVSQR